MTGINLDEASRFISALAGDEPVTFQVFDDRRKNKRPNLARIIHGTLAQRYDVLSAMNEQGAGIYICVNKTDLKGRDSSNIIGLRALFVDSDNGELSDLSCMPPPSIISRSVQGPHIYWLLNPNEPVCEFTRAQKRISARLGTDPVIHDLPRVMRVPGFLHCKDEPRPVTLELCNSSARYGLSEVLAMVPEIPTNQEPASGFVLSSTDKTYSMERARAWMALRDPAIEGSGGDQWTYVTACNLVNDFDLSDAEAMDLMQEWNASCSPPWSTEELETKIKRARKYGNAVPGNKLSSDLVVPSTSQEVDLSFILSSSKHKRIDVERKSIDELLHVPGLVGDLSDWINKCAIKKQPVLALGAAIAAMSAILGRKVRTRTDLRSNLYCVGVVGSCGGKESTRICIKKLFHEIGADGMIGSSFASGSAVETVLSVNPVQLFLIDELGKFMESIKGDTTAGHVKAIIPMLMTMYTASSSTNPRTSYADPDRNKNCKPLNQPSLSLWATTVPGNLFSNTSKDHIGQGLLGRLLVFQSMDNDPMSSRIDIDECGLPKTVKDGFLHWLNAPTNTSPAGNLDDECRPKVVEISPEAWSVFDGFDLTMHKRRKEIREEHGQMSGYDAPYGRVLAIAQKLAMIRACGVSLEDPRIEVEDAEWGRDLAWLLTDSMWYRVIDVVAENSTEANLKRVLASIREHPDGIEKGKLGQKLQWIKPRERNEIYAGLIDAGLISATGTRPVIITPVIK